MAPEKKTGGLKMPEPDETIVFRATSSGGETITLTFGELRILKKLIDAAKPRRR